MTSSAPIDPEVRRRMGEVLVAAIASRSASLAEAAAKARGLRRGLRPALPASTIDEAVARPSAGAWCLSSPGRSCGARRQWLRPAQPEEVADTLAYAMRFDGAGKARRTGVEYAARLAAEQLARQLTMSGFVVMRRGGPPNAPDDT